MWQLVITSIMHGSNMFVKVFKIIFVIQNYKIYTCYDCNSIIWVPTSKSIINQSLYTYACFEKDSDSKSPTIYINVDDIKILKEMVLSSLTFE